MPGNNARGHISFVDLIDGDVPRGRRTVNNTPEPTSRYTSPYPAPRPSLDGPNGISSTHNWLPIHLPGDLTSFPSLTAYWMTD